MPLGEYVPFRDFLGSVPDVLGAAMFVFTPGRQAHVLNASETPVGVFIFYEAVLVAEVTELLSKAQLLVNVSNNAWFGPHLPFQMARMRAIETGRDLLSATTTGITAAICYEGMVLKRTPQFKVAILRAEVTPRTGVTLHVR